MKMQYSADLVDIRRGASKQRLWLSLDVIRGVVFIIDLICILVGVMCAYQYMGYPENHVVLADFGIWILLNIGVIAVFRRFHLYDFQSLVSWPTKSGAIFLAFAGSVLFILGLMFLLEAPQGSSYYKDWLLIVASVGAVGIWLVRGGVTWLIGRMIDARMIGWKVALVGYGPQAERFLSHVNDGGRSWWQFIGIFDERKSRVEKNLGGYPLLGDTEDLIDYVRRGQIQQVVITLPWNAEDRLVTLVDRLQELPVTISIGSDLIGCRFADKVHNIVGGLRVLEVERAPLLGWSGILKRIEDVVLSGLLIILFSPVLAAIAIAIKLDSPGPVIFRQKRYGFNNELITVYKFRSMRNDVSDKGVFEQARKEDPRVTRVGRFIRRTSLDELPQLFNVFEGTMSLVGPRPHPLELNAQYEKLLVGYNGRHKVKPGITGWAQINGWRGETETQEKMEGRVDHDIYYIEHWSIWFDLKILFFTAFKGWVHENAY